VTWSPTRSTTRLPHDQKIAGNGAGSLRPFSSPLVKFMKAQKRVPRCRSAESMYADTIGPRARMFHWTKVSSIPSHGQTHGRTTGQRAGRASSPIGARARGQGQWSERRLVDVNLPSDSSYSGRRNPVISHESSNFHKILAAAGRPQRGPDDALTASPSALCAPTP